MKEITAVILGLGSGAAGKPDNGVTSGLETEAATVSGLRTGMVLGGACENTGGYGWLEPLARYVQGPSVG